MRWLQKPPSPGDPKNREEGVFRRLVQREIARKGHSSLLRHAPTRFANIKLLGELDPHHDADGEARRKLSDQLRKHSHIVEIISAGKDLLISLTHNGVCAVFERETGKRLCYLNITPDEVIRSLFFNKANQSVITVSVFRGDFYSALKCRATPLSMILAGKSDQGNLLFQNEALFWPGFVEFDDVNSKIVTYSAAEKIYTVWDLATYQPLYKLTDPHIHEVKMAPGIILVIFQRQPMFLPLEVRAITTGEVLLSFSYQLHRSKRIDLIEQFQEKLLIKQEGEALQIFDIKDQSKIEVPHSEFPTPSAFVYLYQDSKFLTFRDRTVLVWNLKGEVVSRFEDHVLFNPQNHSTNMQITSRQDIIISFCKNQQTFRGEIHFSEIRTGRCLARISQPQYLASGDHVINNLPSASSATHPLDNITALSYNEEKNETPAVCCAFRRPHTAGVAMQRFIALNTVLRPGSLRGFPQTRVVLFKRRPFSSAAYAQSAEAQIPGPEMQEKPRQLSIEIRIANLIAAELANPSQSSSSAPPVSQSASESLVASPPQQPLSRQIRELSNEYMHLIKSGAPYEQQRKVFQKLMALGLTGTRVWGSALLNAARQEGYDAATSIFTEYLKRGLRPDEFMYRALLYAASSESNWQAVRSRYEEMKLHVKPDAKTFSTVLIHLVRAVKEKRAQGIDANVYEMMSYFLSEAPPNVGAENALVKDLIVQATGLLEKRGQHQTTAGDPLANYQASQQTETDLRELMSTLSSQLRVNRNFPVDEVKVMSIWREAQATFPSRSLIPVSLGLMTVLGERNSIRYLPEVLDFLTTQSYESTELAFWKMMLATWQNDFETVSSTLQSLESAPAQLDQWSFILLHRLLATFRRAVTNKDLNLPKTRQEKYLTQIATMILGLFSDQAWRDQLDTRFLAEGLIAADRIGNISGAVNLWDKAIGIGVRPDQFCYDAMIGALAKRAKLQKAEELLIAGKKEGMRPSWMVYKQLHRAYERAGLMDLAKKYAMLAAQTQPAA